VSVSRRPFAIGFAVDIESQHELGAIPAAITNNTCLLGCHFDRASIFSFTIRLHGPSHGMLNPAVVPCLRLLLRICHTSVERGLLEDDLLRHSDFMQPNIRFAVPDLCLGHIAASQRI
jgi:hypothetical protein